jgi:hypothetical protein
MVRFGREIPEMTRFVPFVAVTVGGMTGAAYGLAVA